MDTGDRLFAAVRDAFVMIVIAVVIIGAIFLFTDRQHPVRLGCGGHTTGPNGELVCREPNN